MRPRTPGRAGANPVRGKRGGTPPRDVHGRIVVVGCLLGLLALAPLWKLIGVQVRDGSDLVEQGEDQRVRRVEIPAQRGSILDRNGTELAISIPRKRVVANMERLSSEGIEDRVDLQQLGRRLAALLDVDPTRLTAVLVEAEADDPWVRLVETVDAETAQRAVDAMTADGIVGAVTLEDSTERVHPTGASARRIIGNLGPDGPGELAGIERSYDDVLAGASGMRRVEQGTEGETIAGADHMELVPRSGSDVQLTLDRTLQHEVERILTTGTADAGAVRGIAIVGRPDSGEILAAGSVERDERTGEVTLSDAPLAFANSYQAGSVFKLVTVAAAVESGQVAPDTTIEVPDRITVEDREFSDHDPHDTEPMTVTQIVSQSSNVGTIKIGLQLGKERLYDALEGFGFGRTTGIAHPAESSGILPSFDDWTDPDLAASSIGTHQSATALQLWAAYNVIANDGSYVQPRLVDSVIAPSGERVTEAVPEPRRVISPESAAAVGGMLQEVVREGTGKELNLPGYAVAAKTGTSRLVSPDRVDDLDGYVWADGRFHYVAAFTGYLPADRPQVSITVLLEDTAPGLTGGTAAGPVFSDLAKLSIRELGIAPSGALGIASTGAPVRAAPAQDSGTEPEGGSGTGSAGQ